MTHMRFARKAGFVCSGLAVLFLTLLLCPQQVHAENIVITSGHVTIGGTPASRNAWRAISFNFAGNGFAATGGLSDGGPQGIMSPCASEPCQPGATVFPNSTTFLDGAGQATFNNTTMPVSWFSRDSTLLFSGPGVVIPNSMASTLVLTTTFNMTGTVFIHSLIDQIPVMFSTTVTGSGIATLTLQLYDPNLGPGGYILSSVRYDFEPVPEPATLLLLSSGLGGLAMRYRRRRNKKSL